MSEIARQEKAIIFSAPSGSGKTSIVRALLDKGLPLEFSISATSREPRGQELNGVDYYFLGINGFKEMVDQNALVEWEEVYVGQFYGTLKSEVERIWRNQKAVIFDVDVYGGIRLKEIFGTKALSIFVQPPSLEALEQRLRGRGTESEEKIQMRLSKASEEIEQGAEFDMILINDELSEAIATAEERIMAFLNDE